MMPGWLLTVSCLLWKASHSEITLRFIFLKDTGSQIDQSSNLALPHRNGVTREDAYFVMEFRFFSGIERKIPLWEFSGSLLWDTHHSVGRGPQMLVLQTMYIPVPFNPLLAKGQLLLKFPAGSLFAIMRF